MVLAETRNATRRLVNAPRPPTTRGWRKPCQVSPVTCAAAGETRELGSLGVRRHGGRARNVLRTSENRAPRRARALLCVLCVCVL